MTNLEYWNKVQEIIDHPREQAKSVFGKDTPVRVEFRYRGKTKHWQYFTDTESANEAVDHLGSGAVSFPQGIGLASGLPSSVGGGVA